MIEGGVVTQKEHGRQRVLHGWRGIGGRPWALGFIPSTIHKELLSLESSLPGLLRRCRIRTLATHADNLSSIPGARDKVVALVIAHTHHSIN